MKTLILQNRVKEYRARHNVTQQQLADFLKMGVLNLRKREQGTTRWRENEMHLVVYFFNKFYGEHFTLNDVFMSVIEE